MQRRSHFTWNGRGVSRLPSQNLMILRFFICQNLMILRCFICQNLMILRFLSALCNYQLYRLYWFIVRHIGSLLLVLLCTINILVCSLSYCKKHFRQYKCIFLILDYVSMWLFYEYMCIFKVMLSFDKLYQFIEDANLKNNRNLKKSSYYSLNKAPFNHAPSIYKYALSKIFSVS